MPSNSYNVTTPFPYSFLHLHHFLHLLCIVELNFIICLIDKFWSYITFVVIGSDPPSNLILTQVNGRTVKVSWTAPSNDVMEYRVFVNNAYVNGDGNIVASGTTTCITTSQFGAGTTVTIRVRATATFWSEVVMESITVRGKCCFLTYMHVPL